MNNHQMLQKVKSIKHNHAYQLKHDLSQGKYNPRTRSREYPKPKNEIKRGNAF